MSDYRHDAHDKSITEISHRLDRAFDHIDLNRNQLTKLQTVLIGVNGENGVKGDLHSLYTQFSAYRREIRQEMKDMSDTLMQAVDGLKKELDSSRKQRKAELISTISLCIAAVGIIIRLII